jgi:hypothetical protein
MLTIWKFPIAVEDEVRVDMPRGAKPLSVGKTHDVPDPHHPGGWPSLVLWALVDTTEPLASHHFTIRGTGHSCAGLDVRAFVGTVIMHDRLVLHVFDRGEAP